MTPLEALVALNLTGLVGTVLHRRLVDRFGSAEAALRASHRDLRGVGGVGEITARAIAKANDGAAARELELAEKRGARVLAFDDPAFPGPLAAVYDAPLVLYVMGEYRPADALAIGIVGSRKCTPYGERQAARFAVELAGLGITIVSGLARGVDTRAHIGAVRSAKGRTIAVLGSGLGRIYPPENAKLFESVCQRGCAMTEFPMQAGPEPANFPRRNRIISGLSLGVLVVEAAEKSGALITADWAMEQGREVFCVPGSLESPMSRGPHALVKQGAKLVENAADLLEELPALAPILAKAGRPASLSPLENTVLSHVEKKPRSAESIAASSRLPESSVSSALTGLLAKRLIAAEDGAYRRA